MCEHTNVSVVNDISPNVWHVTCDMCAQLIRYAPLEFPFDMVAICVIPTCVMYQLCIC